jgi:hypothetical protein
VDDYISKNPDLKVVDTKRISTITVNEIIDKYLEEAPTLINIDIEGKDMEILESINWEKYRPFIIIIEMIHYEPRLVVESKNNDILEFMRSKDYIEYAFTGINSIFIDKTKL